MKILIIDLETTGFLQNGGKIVEIGKTDYIETHRGADDAYHEALIVYELYKMGVFKIENN